VKTQELTNSGKPVAHAKGMGVQGDGPDKKTGGKGGDIEKLRAPRGKYGSFVERDLSLDRRRHVKDQDEC